MTVHRDRISWLTKLDRIGELSAQDWQLVFNNIGHLINVDMLKVDMLKEQYWLLAGNKAIG
ncbi:MAG: group II intron reverse transcriptase/maturase, partial [bacterium]